MVFWLFGIGLLGWIGISYAAYWIAFYNPVHRHHEAVVIRGGKESERLDELCRTMADREYEQVWIHSFDGTPLAGRYYHRNGQAPLFILFHGYRGSGIRDFCASHGICMDMGVDTLVVDQRAHGMSGGNTMTFGILERHDCRRWAEYAADRFGPERPIYLFGVSMGAATVLMAADLSLPGNVVGIIADCPYSSPGQIIRKVIRDMGYPAWLLYPFAVSGALIFGRFRIWQGSAVRSVSDTAVPVLLIHGSEDHYVPSGMSAEIFEHCVGQRYLEIFPGAGHGGCCVTDPVRYEKILRSFMKNCEIMGDS